MIARAVRARKTRASPPTFTNTTAVPYAGAESQRRAPGLCAWRKPRSATAPARAASSISGSWPRGWRRPGGRSSTPRPREHGPRV